MADITYRVNDGWDEPRSTSRRRSKVHVTPLRDRIAAASARRGASRRDGVALHGWHCYAAGVLTCGWPSQHVTARRVA